MESQHLVASSGRSKIFISHAHAKTETGFIDSPGPCAYRQEGSMGSQVSSNPNPNSNPNQDLGDLLLGLALFHAIADGDLSALLVP